MLRFPQLSLPPRMTIAIDPATPAHLDSTLAWLKEEEAAGHGGFYCNRPIIARMFGDGRGACAVLNGTPIGFVLFDRCGDEGEILIVEVHPQHRRQGIAARLMAAAEEHLKNSGAQCIDVECTSSYGEALCRFLGYQDHQDDPRNYRGPYANPTLRKYLTDWRPKERHPWA